MIITLIQTLYDQRMSLPGEASYYELVLHHRETDAIAPTIYYLMKQRGRLEQTPMFFQAYLKRRFDETLYLNLYIRHEMDQLLKRFEACGIPVIPLKGTHFAETYFGHIGARQTSDVDLLVQQQDREQAISCIRSLGYTWEQVKVPSHFHWGFSKAMPHGDIPLTVELHWDVLTKKTSALNINDFWREAAPLEGYKYVMELSGYHTFYHICIHGWSHRMSSLKYYLDIIQMIYGLEPKLDLDRLLVEGEAHFTYKRIVRIISLLYEVFPHLERLHPVPFVRRLSPPGFHRMYYELLDYDTLRHMLFSIIGHIQSRWFTIKSNFYKSEKRI